MESPCPTPPPNWLQALRLCNFQAGGAGGRALPGRGKVAVAHGKCELGKMANVDE
jgi:hypothetical protein